MNDAFDWFDILLTAFVTVLFAALGCWSVGRSLRQIWCWPKAPATVVRYWIKRSEGKSHGQRFFYAVVKYTAVDGRTMTAVSPMGRWRRRWAVGDTVVIRFDPTNSRSIEIACFRDMWGIPAMIFGGGLLFAVMKFWLWDKFGPMP